MFHFVFHIIIFDRFDFRVIQVIEYIINILKCIKYSSI